MKDEARPVYTQSQADARARRAVLADREKRLIRSDVVHCEPFGHLPALALAAAPDIWQHFKVVPPEWYSVEGATAVIECPCGYHEPDNPDMRQQRVDRGALVICPGCQRVYFFGTRLHCAPEPQEGEATEIRHCHSLDEPCLRGCPEYE
jgi:hypothetical protein